MFWIVTSIIGYAFNSVAMVVDKIFITTKVKDPKVYLFYASALACLSFVLWPLDFAFLSLKITLFAIFSGLTFSLAIYYMYAAMARGEASRVISIIGALSPMVILVLSFFFLDERLNPYWYSAFAVLICGAVLLSFEGKGRIFSFRHEEKFAFFSVFSALLFALSYFLSKLVYDNTTFINGFVWTRFGPLAVVLIFLLSPKLRSAIRVNQLNVVPKLSFIFIFNKILAAAAILVIGYSVSVSTSSVALINALQSVQYACVFFIALVLSRFKPELLNENLSLKAVFQKILGICLVTLGIIMLFVPEIFD